MNFYTQQHQFYCGIDLHSNNNVVAIKDGALKDVACRRLPNDLGKVLGFLERYREDLVKVAVESTYNCYWLVDGLQEDLFEGLVDIGNTATVKIIGQLPVLSPLVISNLAKINEYMTFIGA